MGAPFIGAVAETGHTDEQRKYCLFTHLKARCRPSGQGDQAWRRVVGTVRPSEEHSDFLSQGEAGQLVPPTHMGLRILQLVQQEARVDTHPASWGPGSGLCARPSTPPQPRPGLRARPEWTTLRLPCNCNLETRVTKHLVIFLFC